MRIRYWLLIGLLGSIWGCSFLFNAILIRELSPLWVSTLRVSIGAVICWLALLATRRQVPRDLATYAQLLVLGLINYAIPFALFPFAEQTVASGLVGVINAMTPMTTVLVSQLWPGGEKATWNKWLGVFVGFAGAIVLSLPALGAGASGQVLGMLAAFAATIFYAITLNYARRFKSVDPFAVAASSLTGAALASAPVALVFAGLPVITRVETWSALLGIGVFSTGFAFLLLYWLLPRVGATNLSLNTYLAPIAAITLGVVLLGERFEFIHLIGIIIIFAGLVCMDGRIFRRRRPAAA